MNTSKVHINNLYIKYTFVHFAILLIRQILGDKKDGKVNKGILDIHVIDVYFTSVYSNPTVFDTSSVAKSSKLENGSCRMNRN